MKVLNGIFSVQEGVNFDLIDGGFDGDTGVEKFFVVFDDVVGDADVSDFSLGFEFFQCFVGGDVVGGDGPVD